jgi:hypothetical protein
MIRYRLSCDENHEFEAWFKSSEDCDRQLQHGEVMCPQCASIDVAKALMAPSVGKRAPDYARALQVSNVDAFKRREAMALMRKLRQEVEKNADYVGPRFAEDARKIHYEEAEPRGIYGEATKEDALGLHEEGIEFYPMPRLPEDEN